MFTRSFTQFLSSTKSLRNQLVLGSDGPWLIGGIESLYTAETSEYILSVNALVTITGTHLLITINQKALEMHNRVLVRDGTEIIELHA